MSICSAEMPTIHELIVAGPKGGRQNQTVATVAMRMVGVLTERTKLKLVCSRRRPASFQDPKIDAGLEGRSRRKNDDNGTGFPHQETTTMAQVWGGRSRTPYPAGS